VLTWQTQRTLPTLCYQTNCACHFWANSFIAARRKVFHISVSTSSKRAAPELCAARKALLREGRAELSTSNTGTGRCTEVKYGQEDKSLLGHHLCFGVHTDPSSHTLLSFSLKGLSGVMVAVWRLASRKRQDYSLVVFLYQETSLVAILCCCAKLRKGDKHQ